MRDAPLFGGGSIRLLACHTGAQKNVFAQQLANELGVTVRAPNEALWLNEEGIIRVFSIHFIRKQFVLK